jgi:hypothetical protein
MKNNVHAKIPTRMFITALFIHSNPNVRGQIDGWMDGWINKIWSIHKWNIIQSRKGIKY